VSDVVQKWGYDTLSVDPSQYPLDMFFCAEKCVYVKVRTC